MLKNKSILLIMLSVLAIFGVTGFFAFTTVKQNQKMFGADGFVLDPSERVDLTTEVNEQHYFSAGEKYKEKFGEKVIFKDVNGEKITMTVDQFAHLNDGSLFAFSDGALMTIDQVAEEQVSYYNISAGTTVYKNGTAYSLTCLGSEVVLPNLVWKLEDNTYLICAPELTLHISDDQEVTFPDYVQLIYVGQGICRIIHQQGTYQTVSNDATLEINDDIVLNLSAKTFFSSGEEKVGLDSIIIGADDNAVVDKEEPEFVLPTFRAENGANGADGADGALGAQGIAGETGDDGEAGEDGNDGTAGGNGAGGVSGTDGDGGKAGEAGIDGDDGSAGKKGTTGYDGADGGAGKAGAIGADGQNGTAGTAGNNGDWGYDGKEGSDGKQGTDAVSTDPLSGVIAIDQIPTPKVAINTETYKVSSNGVNMDIKVTDEGNLLVSDLTMQIIDAAKNNIVYQDSIMKGYYSAVVNPSVLTPNTKYLFKVSGSYSADGSTNTDKIFQTDFFTKFFTTTSAGISLEKVKVTEDTITVKAMFDGTNEIGSYAVQLYDSDGNASGSAIPAANTDNSDHDFEFTGLTSNTAYQVKLVNVALADASLLNLNTCLDLHTLKKVPYYTNSNNGIDTYTTIAERQPAISVDERYQTVKMNLMKPNDDDNGITGYRFELFENNGSVISENNRVGVMESSTPDIQSFKIQADNTTYVGRVVVLFDDNEKIREFASLYTEVVGIGVAQFPTLTFDQLITQQAEAEVVFTIHDENGMLLDNISTDYPMEVIFNSSYGDAEIFKITEKGTPNLNGGTTYTFTASARKLRKDTDYSVNVQGPVNTSLKDGQEWSQLTEEQKKSFSLTFINGTRFTTGQSAPVVLNFSDYTGNDVTGAFKIQVTTDDFTEALKMATGVTGYTDEKQRNVEYSTDKAQSDYVLNSLNELRFSVYSDGTMLGGSNNHTIVDTDLLDRSSVFYTDGYQKTQVSNKALVLTPSSFGLPDTAFASGGRYEIRLTGASDYANNRLNYLENKYEFTARAAHVQAEKPNEQISIYEIKNKEVREAGNYYNVNLDDNTAVGLTLTPLYTWKDVLSVRYEVYELASGLSEAQLTDLSVTDLYRKTDGNTITLTSFDQSVTYANFVGYSVLNGSNPDAAKSGNSEVKPLNLYYDNAVSLMDAENNSVDYTLRRGKSYLFTYQVISDCQYIDCGSDLTNDIYPNCVTGNNQVYRSAMVCSACQKPTVMRYPSKSASSGSINQLTWAYSITDPDNCVQAYADLYDGGNIIMDYCAYANQSDAANDITGAGSYTDDNGAVVTAGTLYRVTVPAGTVNGTAYQEILIQIPTGKPYYRTTIHYYSGGSTDSIGVIASDPTPNSTISSLPTSESNKILFMGKSNDEPAVMDLSGGEIRLTLMSKNETSLKRLSGIRVTITSKANSSITHTFDPVPIQLQTGKTTSFEAININDSFYYAYAYLDFTKYSDWSATADTVTVDVTGYYTTGRFGIDNMLSESATDISGEAFTANNSYAISSPNKNSYLYAVPMTGGIGWLSTSGGASPSIITEGTPIYDDNAQLLDGEGFQLKAGTMGSGSFNIFFTNDCLNLSEDYVTMPNWVHSSQEILFDKNGMYYIENDSPVYMIPEIIVEGKIGNTRELILKAQLPKVNNKSTSVGVKTAVVNFAVIGDVRAVAHTDIIYAELCKIETNGTLVSKEPVSLISKTADVNGQTVTYYEATEGTVTPTIAGIPTQGGIPILVDGENKSCSLQIIGLNPKSSYVVRLFMPQNGTFAFLYDFGARRSGVEYRFDTLESVNIYPSEYRAYYNSYKNKGVVIDYRIDGAGMGYDLYYQLKNSDGTVILGNDGTFTGDAGRLTKKGSSSYSYYSNEFGANTPINLSMSPGNQKLMPGGTYTLVVQAIDVLTSDPNSRNIGTVQKVFTVNDFTYPKGTFQFSVAAESINVKFAPTDINRVIYADPDSAQIGPYNLKVYKVDSSTEGIPISEQTPVNVITESGIYNATIEGLLNNTTYLVVATCSVDRNNDGVAEESDYEMGSFSATTMSASSINVSGALNSENKLVISLSNPSNFGQVSRILYTFNTADSSVVKSESVPFILGTSAEDGFQYENGIYNYVTDVTVTQEGSYSLSMNYFSNDGKMIGSITGQPVQIYTINQP